MELTDTDYAYIAGLLDGEGSFVVAKHFAKTKHCGKRGWVWELRISVGMSDKEGLEFIMQKFDKKRLREAKGSKRLMYYLTLYSNEIRKFLPPMLQHIRVKKKQAELLLDALSIIKPKSNPESDARLEKIYLRMKVLNKSRHKPI
ncbi:MAG: LAGLIDADG family homing endonuclease [Candidatus Yanofskybacteria bacterium]|nr:LAGLIDADG family homing endonuclease [Candidatus Yanofskybacteria bacterium]